jgi:hypothetical protein
MKSESYRTAQCCYGANCIYFFDEDENEPCWGQVDVVDETDEGDWVHVCEGHHSTYNGDDYTKEPTK